jgi:hypothetical protein
VLAATELGAEAQLGERGQFEGSSTASFTANSIR